MIGLLVIVLKGDALLLDGLARFSDRFLTEVVFLLSSRLPLTDDGLASWLLSMLFPVAMTVAPCPSIVLDVSLSSIP